MRKLLGVGAFAMLVSLAACMTPQEIQAQREIQTQRDGAECQQLGFRPGSNAFGDCILKLREIRAQEDNTNAIQQSRMDDWGGPWGGYPYRHYPGWW